MLVQTIGQRCEQYVEVSINMLFDIGKCQNFKEINFL